MDDWRFSRHQMKPDRSFSGIGGKIETAVCFHLHRPTIDPGQSIAGIESSFAKAAATRLIIEKEFLASRIGDREMRKFQIIHDQPRSGFCSLFRWSDSLTKKGQLVAKASPTLVR